MRPILLATLLMLLASTSIADDRALPIAKRMSIEKVLLAEQYQKRLQECREEKRKAVRERCQAKKKTVFDEQMAALHDNPRGYFQNKERQGQDEQLVRQPGKGD